MKKLLSVVLLLSLAVSLIACDIGSLIDSNFDDKPPPQTDDSSDPTNQNNPDDNNLVKPLPSDSNNIDPDERGYSLGHPFAISKDEWIYYEAFTDINWDVGFLSDYWNLHRMKVDGTGVEVLDFNFSMSNINIIGDWIYATSSDAGSGRGIYRFRPDGSELNKIVDASDWGGGSFFLIVGDWLYYQSYGIGFNRVRTADGTEHLRIHDEHWSNQISGDWFYYQAEFGAGNVIYRGRTDGSRGEEISIPSVNEIAKLQICGDWLYFLGSNQQAYYSLYKFNVETNELIQVIEEYCSSYIVSDDWVYYTYTAGAGDDLFHTLHRVRIDGTGRIKINDIRTLNFNVAGDWIFFMGDMEAGEGDIIYRIRTDGSSTAEIIGSYPY